MDAQLLRELSRITPEESRILHGDTAINRELYMDGADDRINASKLLAAGKLITLRPHTRFIHFPPHSHDYVEMVYMCSGHTTHIINGQKVELNAGELLLLSQSAVQEIQKAGREDVAVNFIVLPQFFTPCLDMIGQEKTAIRCFLVDCLCGKETGAGYLHFRVSQAAEVQNLVENLIRTLLGNGGAKRWISQMTMSLLFLELMNHTEELACPENEDTVTVRLLHYIDREYTTGSLADASELLHYDISWMSRQIKRRTGKTFTQLIQEKRMSQAAFLLKNTDQPVGEIALAVGYENTSYFHRLFRSLHGVSPRCFREKYGVAREDAF